MAQTDTDVDATAVADTRPALQRDLVREPEHCLSFNVRGSWAHFRRVDTNTVKQSYRVMPRTTVAGMLAAILGLERDSYYDLFSPETSAVAIEPQFDLRSVNMPINTLSTDSNSLESHSGDTMSAKVPNPGKGRQQHNYEFLVDADYRIDVWLADDEVYEELRTKLDDQKAHYSPSLGLSECLASITYHDEIEIEPATDDRSVDSAVPADTTAIIPGTGVEYSMERSPGFMTAETDHKRGRTTRQTTGFIDWVYTTTEEPDDGVLETTGVPTSIVGDRVVVFS